MQGEDGEKAFAALKVEQNDKPIVVTMKRAEG